MVCMFLSSLIWWRAHFKVVTWRPKILSPLGFLLSFSLSFNRLSSLPPSYPLSLPYFLPSLLLLFLSWIKLMLSDMIKWHPWLHGRGMKRERMRRWSRSASNVRVDSWARIKSNWKHFCSPEHTYDIRRNLEASLVQTILNFALEPSLWFELELRQAPEVGCDPELTRGPLE